MTKPFTYGQIEDALLALGFQKHEVPGSHSYFTHPTSDIVLIYPPYTRSTPARERHVVATRHFLHEYGYLDRDEFDSFVRNLGKIVS
jgi:hypothetical protein